MVRCTIVNWSGQIRGKREVDYFAHTIVFQVAVIKYSGDIRPQKQFTRLLAPGSEGMRALTLCPAALAE